MSGKIVTQEQERIIYAQLDALIAQGRIRNEGKQARVYLVDDDAGVQELRGALRLAIWLKATHGELIGLHNKTIGWYISKHLCKKLGSIFHKNGSVQRKTIARLAKAELQRRLGSMSVAELAELAK